MGCGGGGQGGGAQVGRSKGGGGDRVGGVGGCRQGGRGTVQSGGGGSRQQMTVVMGCAGYSPPTWQLSGIPLMSLWASARRRVVLPAGGRQGQQGQE